MDRVANDSIGASVHEAHSAYTTLDVFAFHAELLKTGELWKCSGYSATSLMAVGVA